ncbi:Protein of unknown function [Thermobacillus xylanilyticus]|uniref:Uncharacterized protein n=1 Tax=Thermobacillus xylanilyticus TaxID=76633 RepID=A0ABN7RV45_THEXY|nr:Protein of unknown function [Thermobacillus xylanilyticus]
MSETQTIMIGGRNLERRRMV